MIKGDYVLRGFSDFDDILLIKLASSVSYTKMMLVVRLIKRRLVYHDLTRS
jgi:hypothetical protein